VKLVKLKTTTYISVHIYLINNTGRGRDGPLPPPRASPSLVLRRSGTVSSLVHSPFPFLRFSSFAPLCRVANSSLAFLLPSLPPSLPSDRRPRARLPLSDLLGIPVIHIYTYSTNASAFPPSLSPPPPLPSDRRPRAITPFFRPPGHRRGPFIYILHKLTRLPSLAPSFPSSLPPSLPTPPLRPLPSSKNFHFPTSWASPWVIYTTSLPNHLPAFPPSLPPSSLPPHPSPQTVVLEQELPLSDLLGIAVGHLYHYASTQKLVRPPSFLIEVFAREKLRKLYKKFEDDLQ